MVSYRCDKPEGKDLSGELHETMVSPLYIRSNVSHKEFGSLGGAAALHTNGTQQLAEIRNILNMISAMHGKTYWPV